MYAQSSAHPPNTDTHTHKRKANTSSTVLIYSTGSFLKKTSKDLIPYAPFKAILQHAILRDNPSMADNQNLFF